MKSSALGNRVPLPPRFTLPSLNRDLSFKHPCTATTLEATEQHVYRAHFSCGSSIAHITLHNMGRISSLALPLFLAFSPYFFPYLSPSLFLSPDLSLPLSLSCSPYLSLPLSLLFLPLSLSLSWFRCSIEDMTVVNVFCIMSSLSLHHGSGGWNLWHGSYGI